MVVRPLSTLDRTVQGVGNPRENRAPAGKAGGRAAAAAVPSGPLAPTPSAAETATDIESEDLHDIAELARQLEQRIR